MVFNLFIFIMKFYLKQEQDSTEKMLAEEAKIAHIVKGVKARPLESKEDGVGKWSRLEQ